MRIGIFLVVFGCYGPYLLAQSFAGNVSATYDEAIARYTALANEHGQAQLLEVGLTDVGRPLHLFIMTNPEVPEGQKTVLLINNGIHPGEPCGIDASLQLAERILLQNHELNHLLDSVIVGIVPVYNIGGALRRGCCVRANQDGPEAYGFRGNARNLDLNRDFIKADSRNTKAFYRLFHMLSPHVVIDTHTSNGADYSYVMTMLNTQPDKAGERIGNYMREKMNPSLYAAMENVDYPMIPYILSMGKTPETGLIDYLETPRYTTGYAALFNAIGYTSETHMLKPFAARVESTYRFIVEVLRYMHSHNSELISNKLLADQEVMMQTRFALNWALDTTQFREIPFRGYEAEYLPSEVTGATRLRYNRLKPYTRQVKYFDRYQTVTEAEAPVGYVIPFAWHEVIERFELNQVEMHTFLTDTALQVQTYYLDDVESSPRAYEGRHMKTVKSLRVERETLPVFKGDRFVRVNQVVNRFIVETLEPQAVDAYFRWGFFDSVLQQKEWYSDYVFEDRAASLLADDPALRLAFEEAKRSDANLAASPKAQLQWVYQHSPHYEGSANRYPIYRVTSPVEFILNE